MGFYYVGQADLEFLTSGDSSASASQSAEIKVDFVDLSDILPPAHTDTISTSSNLPLLSTLTSLTPAQANSPFHVDNCTDLLAY
ncbi:hypothetical protein AAY473_015049 [Plecturocebus cupreus]